MKTTPDTIAANVRAEMARRGISTLELSQLTGIARSTLARRLTGRYDLTVGELLTIADAVGVPLSTLIPDLTNAA